MKPNDKAIKAALRATSDSCSAYQIQNALDAAYAAQFPPSEDYAELIETLRSSSPYTLSHVAADALETLLAKLNCKPKPSEDYAELIERLRFRAGIYKGTTDDRAAADALEALLAERDALKAELAAANKRAANRLAVEAERDALLARLASVDDEALVEIAADAIDTPLPSLTWGEREGGARAAIAAIRPHIEAAERERCAKIADKYEGEWHSDTADACARAIAAAIRSGK